MTPPGTADPQRRFARMDLRGATWLIYNGSSGSHDDDVLRDLVEGMRAAGAAPDEVRDCKHGTPDAREAERLGIGLVVIHGGDGTLNRTIGDLEGYGGAVLPLPGGTFNLLAREIFGERDARAIVSMLGRGELVVRRRTCIRGDGVTALSELLAGPGAKWADVREELREANVGEVIVKGWDAAATSTVGPMVALERPALGRDDGYAGIRMCPRAAGIAIQGYGAENLGDYVQQGLAILKRDFRDGPHDDLGRARAVTCRSLEDEPIPLMIDGERSEGAATVRFSLDTLDVDLLGIADGR
ncbi:diacylglycerol kinase family protein [Tsuneonella sp. YG55]|uniref:Diacylglycerol kinase family protein n=1 Tax=Tsuneonella litorea TaxID=2976475 RepID=A0A9X3AM55_9SPHN|nr:diacylglycerol kinase family protein [Tsuneonella litorea]MCT2557897.1 diacylglycerol kinase family protein [Tsuneonella litorea]